MTKKNTSRKATLASIAPTDTPTDTPPDSAPRVSSHLALVPDTTPEIVTSDTAPIQAVLEDRHGVGFVDPEGKARAEHYAKIMAHMGHDVKPTVYPIGFTVNDIGVANARKHRMEFESLPKFDVAIPMFCESIGNEKRIDLVGSIKSTRLLPDGTLVTTAPWHEIAVNENGNVEKIEWPSGLKLKVEEKALLDLAEDARAALPPGAPMPESLSRALVSSPPDLRAAIYNYWQEYDFDRVEREGLVLMRPDKLGKLSPVRPGDDKVRKFRTRIVEGGERALYATVGEDFPPIDVDFIAQIAQVACRQIDGDIRARIDYNGRNVRITLVSHSTIKPENYVAGEVFRASAFLGTDDTGGGSIWGYGAVDVNLCRNLIIVDHSKAGAFRVQHRGTNMEKLIRDLVDGVRNAFQSIAVFAELWSKSCREGLYLPEGIESTPKALNQRAEVFAMNAAALVTKRARSSYMLSMPGTSDAARVQKIVPDLLRAWKKDLEVGSSAVKNDLEGLSRGAMVNALTRYAHETERDSFRGADLEREAGDLLTARPWKLPTVDQWAEWETSPSELISAAGLA